MDGKKYKAVWLAASIPRVWEIYKKDGGLGVGVKGGKRIRSIYINRSLS